MQYCSIIRLMVFGYQERMEFGGHQAEVSLEDVLGLHVVVDLHAAHCVALVVVVVEYVADTDTGTHVH